MRKKRVKTEDILISISAGILLVIIALSGFYVKISNIPETGIELKGSAELYTGKPGLFYGTGESVPNEAWNATGPVGTAYGIAVDDSGNVYVTGAVNNDYYTIKYNSTGDEIRTSVSDCNGVGVDASYGINIDDFGNVYVTGAFCMPGFHHTIKYDSNLNEIWNSSGEPLSFLKDVSSDKNGFFYGVGESNGDFYIIKYNATNNATIWNTTIADGTGYGVAVDNQGFVYFTGKIFVGSNNNIYTIKYNSTENTTIWANLYDSGDNEDIGYDIAVDDSGNVYVTGSVANNYYTIKYNSTGDEMWNATENSGAANDRAYGIVVDNLGFVYVTGVYSEPTGNYYTVKYNATNGSKIWSKVDVFGTAYDIYVDSMENIYVTGISNLNFYTIKYGNTTSLTDAIYPIFFNYKDNNATLISSGIAWFNVTVENTNGTVIFEINNTNYTATNLSANVYNVSVSLASNGTYFYRWHSWGNGTNPDYNVSETRSYAINTSQDTNAPVINLITPDNAYSYTSNSQSINFNYNVSDESNVDNCSLIINSITNITDLSVTEDITQNFNQIFVPGSYTWSIRCNDALNNIGNSVSRTFTVTAPTTGTSSENSEGGPTGTSASCSANVTCRVWSQCLNGTMARNCTTKCYRNRTLVTSCIGCQTRTYTETKNCSVEINYTAPVEALIETPIPEKEGFFICWILLIISIILFLFAIYYYKKNEATKNHASKNKRK
ncbi:MAG: SBBP repeat-containing protein [Candidatus Nanoarchaeia archaeon]|nr:SBBP repeat-containing protein [Candidatus Nanoarchaeia archaeon]